MIKKELDEYYKANKALRTKICEYFNQINGKINVHIFKDNEKYERCFVEMKNGMLKDDSGDWYDSDFFNTGELLDVWDQLEQYVKIVVEEGV